MDMTPGAISGLRLREEDAVGVSSRGAGDLAVGGRALAPPADRRAIAVEAPQTDSVFSRVAFHRGLLAVADLACTTTGVVWVLALFGRTGTAVAALACMPLVLAIFKLAGLYDRDELRVTWSTLDELPRLLQVTGLLVLGVAILQPVLFSSSLTGLQIAMLWIALFLAVMCGRLLVRWVSGRVSAVERCLVVGDLEQAHRIRERLAESRARARVIACLPLSTDDLADVEIATFASDLIRDLQIHRVIVAPAASDTSGGAELIRMAKTAGVGVSVLPPIIGVIGSDVEFEEVNGLTLLGIRGLGLRRSGRLLKRAFDIVVASAILVLFGPIISAIALAIRLDSKGPVFFRQVRVGRNGEHFWMVKFRSMVSDADTLKEQLRSDSEVGDGLFKIADDPRVTAVGRFLRRSSLDELPQIFNVLRGEMSLVGPRPLIVEEDAKIVGLARTRLELTPGMTGPWQILGLRLPLHEMVEIDFRYVSNWSLWLDLKLLLRTVSYTLRRGNV
jgi:exopolysaccharide biosynthesis polyprenyl glycosylphosphotransferase